jgi:hypothetical protein
LGLRGFIISKYLASKQVDFGNAFVQAKLGANKHINIKVPKGFNCAEGGETMVLKLKRSLLYGLVQRLSIEATTSKMRAAVRWFWYRPLILESKLQTEVALSTTEAEYIALSQLMRGLIPMWQLLQEAGTALKLTFAKPAILHSTVFEDNNGALSLALSPKMTPRTKHIAVKYHHFCTSVGED